MNYKLSIFFGFHDSSITIANENQVMLHLEAERVLRKKHTRLNSEQMIELICRGLDHLSIDIKDLKEVYLASWNNQFTGDKILMREKWFKPILTSHHLNHIGALKINTEDCLVICADGGSEDGTTKFYLKSGNEIELLKDCDSEIITGKFYGTITQMIIDPRMGRAHDTYPGKTMGLSALGEYSTEIASLIYNNLSLINNLNIEGVDHLRKIFNISSDYEQPWDDKRRCDLAKTAQIIWEDEFIKQIQEFKHLSENIGITGGCALNVLLNTRIEELNYFKKIFLSPVPNDSGQSLGALLHHHPNLICNYPYLGRGFGEFILTDDVLDKIVEDLTNHKIISWYQNRSEVGPRALGNRSLICLPDSIEMKNKISVLVKGREAYRPVAPIVAEEFLTDYFDTSTTSPYMSYSPRSKEITKEKCPAIVHVDGTSRVQTVSETQNQNVYKILLKLKSLGLPPIIMNTSFNSNGEPIVDSPEDALRNFYNSKADVLYINGVRYEQK
jgi:carbamoyltransferase